MQTVSLAGKVVVLVTLAAIVSLLTGPTSSQRNQWLEVKHDDIRPALLALSGMAVWKESATSVTLLVIHDNKLDNQPRAGIVEISRTAGPQYHSVVWPAPLPVDLEAIAAVPSRQGPKTFVALTSAGKVHVFQLVVESHALAVRIIKTDNVPDDPQFTEREGFALQIVDGSLIAVWADRGCRAPCLESSPPRAATLIWSRFDAKEYKFLDRGPVKDRSRTITVGFPSGPCVRPISDIKIDAKGSVFVASARECENADTKLEYQSAAFEIGTLRLEKSGFVFREHRSQRPLVPQIHKYKIEALEFLPRRKGSFIFGTDDELNGGRLLVQW